MQIYIGADHGGFKLAEELLLWCKENKLPIENVGAFTFDKDDDYVDFSQAAAEKVTAEIVAGRQARGIVICRSGVGVDLVANKKRYIRCCLGFNEQQIRKARIDDDVNMLALPSDYLDVITAKKFVEIFLNTEFSTEERYVRRVQKVENMRSI
ncbi:MAG: RpiB/LacA/LacB family sugar-phosphate isomerase [Rhabdochlamydiaceae bacterium]